MGQHSRLVITFEQFYIGWHGGIQYEKDKDITLEKTDKKGIVRTFEKLSVWMPL